MSLIFDYYNSCGKMPDPIYYIALLVALVILFGGITFLTIDKAKGNFLFFFGIYFCSTGTDILRMVILILIEL